LAVISVLTLLAKLLAVIIDALSQGNCYYRVADMSGCIKEVQELISLKQLLSICVHCSNHLLDLALQETAHELANSSRCAASVIGELVQLFESLPETVGTDPSADSVPDLMGCTLQSN